MDEVQGMESRLIQPGSSRVSRGSRGPNGILWKSVSALCIAVILILPAISSAAGKPNRVSVEGEVDVLHIDEFDKGKSRMVYWIKDKVTGDRTELVFDREPPQSLRSGMQVTLRGRKADRKFHVSEIVSGLQETGSFEGAETDVSEAGTGTHHAIVMIVNMPDSPGEASYPSTDDPGTPGDESAPLYYNSGHISQVEAQMFNNNYSVDSMYRESSFDQLSFPATMGNNVVLVEIPYFSGCPYYSIASAADSAASAAGVNLGSYHNRIYLVPPSSISDCSWLALGQVGSYGGSSVKLSWSTRNDTVAYAHELGHNLGWHHSGTDPNLDGVWDSEYGDTSGIMGYCCYKRKVNSVHVDQIGWYDAPDLADTVVTVFASGTYQIAPLGSDPTVNLHPQILKIDKTDTNEMYYISYRRQVGLDAGMPSKYANGASIHHASETGNRSYEVKIMDNGNNSQYVDNANGLTLTQLGNDANSVTLDINFVNCARSAPLVAVGPATQLLAANGQTANYTMSVTNNDSQGCENSTFNLALDSVVAFSGSNVTSGFSHNLSATSMNLAPGQSTGINLSLTPQAVADSNFTLTVKANDLSVGVHNGSGQAELMLDSQAPASPSDLTATHRKVKGQKSVLLEWTAAVDASPGSGVVSYRIYRNGVLVGQVAELKFADSNYSSTGANDYTVYSTDQAGHVSEAPAAVSYTDGGGSGGPRRGNGKKRK
jgi:hypothetical protein